MRHLRIILFIFFLHLSCTAFAQVFLGLRDNQYGLLGYTFKNHYSAMLEQSIFTQLPATQHSRISFSYKDTDKWLDYGAKVYIGSQWNGSSYDMGGLIWGSLLGAKIGSLDVTLNPHYDSGYSFNLCFMGGGAIRITDSISVISHYLSIPEYRVVENRVRCGLLFKTEHLQVSPVVSISLDEDPRTMRILTSMMYQF